MRFLVKLKRVSTSDCGSCSSVSSIWTQAHRGTILVPPSSFTWFNTRSGRRTLEILPASPSCAQGCPAVPYQAKRLGRLHTMLPRRLVRRVSAYHVSLININTSHKSCCRREAAPNLMCLCLPRTYLLCLSFLECCVFRFYSFRLDCNF